MPSEIRGSDNFDSDSVGKVLQVVTVKESNVYSTNSGSWDTRMTGLDIVITPSSTSSKIMLFSTTEIGFQYNNSFGAADFYRSISGGASTYNLSGEVKGLGISYGLYTANVSLSYLDAPATTSAVTYSVAFKWAGGGVGTVYMGRNDGAATIIAMEIQG
jgi:hypothetical protein